MAKKITKEGQEVIKRLEAIEWQDKNNYVDFPPNTCFDCEHSKSEPDGNGHMLWCGLGQFEVSYDGICDKFKEQ